MRPFSGFVVFVDESGDHSLEVINPEYPVFVLAFCIVPCDAYSYQITSAVRRLKFEIFGHDLVVLHEHALRKKTGHFAQLSKKNRDALFDGLTQIISDAPMTIIAVVIDKNKHKAKYSNPYHPYGLAMQYGLERVYGFMKWQGVPEQRTMVVCEARGAKEDKEIELAFRRVCDGDNASNCPYPFSIVIADKKSNSEGLQVADLIARPIGLHILRPDQQNRAWDVIERKLYRSPGGGVVIGHGLKVFP